MDFGGKTFSPGRTLSAILPEFAVASFWGCGGRCRVREGDPCLEVGLGRQYHAKPMPESEVSGKEARSITAGSYRKENTCRPKLVGLLTHLPYFSREHGGILS